MNLLRISSKRNPKKGVSTVRTNAEKPAASALFTKLFVTVLKKEMIDTCINVGGNLF